MGHIHLRVQKFLTLMSAIFTLQPRDLQLLNLALPG